MPFSSSNAENLNHKKDIIDAVFFYSSIIIVPIGFVLNIIQIKVFSSKDFEKLNIGFLMKIFVYFDTLALVWSFLIFQYLPSIGLDPALFSNLSCHTFYYISRTIQEIPSFIQAFISFINYLSVNHSKKPIYIYFKDKCNLKLSFTAIILIISLLNIPNMFRELKNEKSISDGNFNFKLNKSCVSKSVLFQIISTSETAILRSILPLFFITLISVLNIKALIQSKNYLNMNLKREKRFGFVLACMCILYLIFNLPLSIVQLTEVIYKLKSKNDSKYLINIEFIYDLTRAWAFIYNGMGFFVNITFNKIFRKNFIQIFLCKPAENTSHFRVTFKQATSESHETIELKYN
jgi:hypothetical protein